nr:ralA-binding protein 1-like [Leptinotarsa decemlineata]
MDFDSPDVMKSFPGLYASELNKKGTNDSDYSDEAEKGMKKETSIGKRKDKKDKKEKEHGYAALEGESSDEASKSRHVKMTPNHHTYLEQLIRALYEKLPEKELITMADGMMKGIANTDVCSIKTGQKENRLENKIEQLIQKLDESVTRRRSPVFDGEQSRKEIIDKRKDKDKKADKKCEKDKGRKTKHSIEEAIDISEALPIFGVSLDISVERSRCHDGLDLPLPIRDCIDYVEAVGMSFEGVYKVSGTKAKVSQLRKMYNHRQNVRLNDYDVPTATSLLKMFLRDLPEPIFTNDLLIRFEEAGAILNFNTREKHLRILIDHLPPLNKLLLSWLIVHLNNISLKEKQNKMNKQNISAALNHTFHVSSRLLQALLHHCQALFPNVIIIKYIPPLSSGMQLPDKPSLLERELEKQESLLYQIHKEMNVGCIPKDREEKLWEVQRIITQLKRKLKIVQKNKEVPENTEKTNFKGKKNKDYVECLDNSEPNCSDSAEVPFIFDNLSAQPQPCIKSAKPEVSHSEPSKDYTKKQMESSEEMILEKNDFLFDDDIVLLTYKRNGLLHLKEQLSRDIQNEKKEIDNLKTIIESTNHVSKQTVPKKECLNEVMDLLLKENQILEIKKINLVRQIIEQKEICIELSAQLRLATNDNIPSHI